MYCAAEEPINKYWKRCPDFEYLLVFTLNNLILNLPKRHIMKEFMLLFRGADDLRRDFSPEEKQAHFTRWREWIGGMAAAGNLVGSQPLRHDTGQVVTGTAKKLTDGPFMEGKEIIGGYTIVRAESYEAAVAIAKGCPNLEAESGSVEVREVTEM